MVKLRLMKIKVTGVMTLVSQAVEPGYKPRSLTPEPGLGKPIPLPHCSPIFSLKHLDYVNSSP